MKETFAVISALLVIVGNLSYSIDIVRGRVKPHAYTWFVWSVVSGIVLVGQFYNGAGVGAIPTAVNELFALINLLLSLKYGYREVTMSDTVFLAAAICGIIIWIFTKDATGSMVFAVGIDVIAFIPTLRKAFARPDTEKPLLYSANIVRHIFAIASLEAYSLVTTLHSIAMLVTNTVMIVILAASNIRPRRPS